MRILMYDNDKIYMSKLKGYLRKSRIIRECDKIDMYSTWGTLLDSQRLYDIAFLEDKIDDMSGLELAKKLKEKNENLYVIFLAENAEKMQEAFKVRAFRYYIKHKDEKKIGECLKCIWDENEKGECIEVHTKNEGIEFIKFSDIAFIESKGDYVVINGDKEKYYSRMSLKYFEGFNKIETLFRCHRSYIVNLKKVIKVEKETLQMKNGDIISVARRRRSELIKKLEINLISFQ